MTVTADDTESVADAPTPTGKERCSSPATSARRHCPWTPTYRPSPRRRGWPRRRLGVACTSPEALPPLRVLYERHPPHSRDGGPAQASRGSTYTQVYTVLLIRNNNNNYYHYYYQCTDLSDTVTRTMQGHLQS